jgi:hypothetical protein
MSAGDHQLRHHILVHAADNAGRILDGVRFIDPFAVRNANFIAQWLP